MGGKGESVGQSSLREFGSRQKCLLKGRARSQGHSCSMAHVSPGKNFLETSVRKKVGRRAEATGEGKL